MTVPWNRREKEKKTENRPLRKTFVLETLKRKTMFRRQCLAPRADRTDDDGAR